MAAECKTQLMLMMLGLSVAMSAAKPAWCSQNPATRLMCVILRPAAAKALSGAKTVQTECKSS